MRETSTEQNELNYIIDFLKNSPRVPKAEWTETEKKSRGHLQFHENFHSLFGALKKRDEGLPKNQFDSYLLDLMEEEHPKEWNRFLKNNKELINKIDNKLEDTNKYMVVVLHTRNLIGKTKEHANELKQLDDLNPEEVGVYYWRQLNPLLEEAANKLEEMGIDLKEFRG